MSKETAKRVLGIGYKVLSWFIVAATVCMVAFTLFSTLTFDRNDRNLFGFRFYIVLTDSMSPSENNKDEKVHFNAGDLIIIKNVKDVTELKEKDIIAFVSKNSDSYGETITHMIRKVEKTDDGNLVGFVTYGTNTGKNDEVIVEPEFVLGTYAGKLTAFGHFFSFLKSTTGYLVCILTPFLLLILWQLVNTVRLYRRYKAEQMADIKAEREQIAKEREESAAMLRELQALREELSRQSADKQTEQTESLISNTDNTKESLRDSDTKTD